jgi:flagellar basal-body rod modification protein FlgD
MAISATNTNTSITSSTSGSAYENPNGVLGKDDFLKLLLVELQYQDPTEPMDSEKILTQTSELATLESAENTNKALEQLSASLASSQQFSTIAAIGKMADLGSDAISHEKATTSDFEVYFPNTIKDGVVEISDSDGNVIKTLDVGSNPAGVYRFSWDGMDQSGNVSDEGIYHINATYTDGDGNTQQTRLGAYPIESVRFDGAQTLVKVGSNYIPIENVKEVY